MSVKSYEEAKRLVDEAGGGDFNGIKATDLIDQAEVALNVRFPLTYRRFLNELGCGNVGGFEIFGVIDGNFHSSAVPNGIWLTLNERKTIGLDPKFVIVGEDGDGGYYVIDTQKISMSGDAPVLLLSPNGILDKIADDFGDYFPQMILEITFFTG